MKKIDKGILKHFNKDELAELTRLMEAVESHEYYYSGYKWLSGGWADSEITDILIGDDYDEKNDIEYDFIEFELESGVQNEGGCTVNTSRHKISKRILNDTKLSLVQKMEAIQEA